MKNYSTLKEASSTSRNLLDSLLDISSQDFTASELKLLSKCRLNALDLFRDILVILSRSEARNVK